MSRWSAQHYDEHRLAPPPAAVEVICAGVGESVLDVLDVGCGTGLFTRMWESPARNVVGVDPDADMLAVARAKSPTGRFVRGSGERLPVRSGSFQVITFASSIHWLDPVSTAAEVVRVLRPGGVLAVVGAGDPRASDLPETADLVRGARTLLLARERARRPRTWRWDDHFAALKGAGLTEPQIHFVTTDLSWSVTDVVRYLGTTGAAAGDTDILPALAHDLTQRLGRSARNWEMPWRVALLHKACD